MDGFIKLADDSPLEEMKGNYLHISKKGGRNYEGGEDKKTRQTKKCRV